MIKKIQNITNRIAATHNTQIKTLIRKSTMMPNNSAKHGRITHKTILDKIQQQHPQTLLKTILFTYN